MNVPVVYSAETNLQFVLSRATMEARVILVVLALFSVFAWYMMVFKGMQMRRAKKLNRIFDSEFRAQTWDSGRTWVLLPTIFIAMHS